MSTSTDVVPTIRDSIAKEIHYPACWDTAAYPTLEDALLEIVCATRFACSECAAAPEDERATLAAAAWATSNTPVREALAYRDGFTAGLAAGSGGNELRADISADRQYIAGIKQGWNFRDANDEKGFQACIEGRLDQIRQASAAHAPCAGDQPK